MHTARSFLTLIKGAKRIEWIALAAALAVLILLGANYLTKREEPTGATEQEARVAAALNSVSGAGKVRVLIGEGDGGGVLVVAEGADDVRVALELARAVSTLLGVPNERIEVLKMNGGA